MILPYSFNYFLFNVFLPQLFCWCFHFYKEQKTIQALSGWWNSIWNIHLPVENPTLVLTYVLIHLLECRRSGEQLQWLEVAQKQGSGLKMLEKFYIIHLTPSLFSWWTTVYGDMPSTRDFCTRLQYLACFSKTLK